MSRFLYGAAVQGIQQFIFKTNELKSIIVASDIVKKIGDDKFAELLNARGLSLTDPECQVINAAGNIKYIFNKKVDCEYVVRNFPRIVLEYAPGITISQAVVELAEEADFGSSVNELERKLREQRNKPLQSLTLGLMGLNRDISGRQNKENLQDTNSQLAEDAFGEGFQALTSTDKMNRKNDWIAVIHADGNGLGQIVQTKGHDRVKFQEFSQKLDEATKQSAQEAFQSIKNKVPYKVPIRPIVLGGDDFTVICRADLAIEYVTNFIEAFERNSPEGLTACAGIAFIKSSFPFYYAYELAESLCSEAKKASKAINKEKAPSSIMFHKIQDSFLIDYKDIVARELTTPKVSFKFGPYFLHPQSGYWTIQELLDKVRYLKDLGKSGNAIKSRLRNWMTLMMTNPEMAQQDLNRILSITDQRDFVQTVTQGSKVPVYDILALRTINKQVTKKPKHRHDNQINH